MNYILGYLVALIRADSDYWVAVPTFIWWKRVKCSIFYYKYAGLCPNPAAFPESHSLRAENMSPLTTCRASGDLCNVSSSDLVVQVLPIKTHKVNSKEVRNFISQKYFKKVNSMEAFQSKISGKRKKIVKLNTFQSKIWMPFVRKCSL